MLRDRLDYTEISENMLVMVCPRCPCTNDGMLPQKLNNTRLHYDLVASSSSCRFFIASCCVEPQNSSVGE